MHMRMIRYFLGGLLALTNLSLPLSAQIWPGDISNNGEVNGIDWLYYGVAFGNTGAPRIEKSFEWAGHMAPENWSNFFSEGHNFSYADCNGDGVINQEDGAAIQINKGLRRSDVSIDIAKDSLSFGKPEIHPSLYFSDQRKDTIKILQGESLSIPIQLGTSAIPVERFYGLRFKMNVPDSLTQRPIEINKTSDSWIGTTLLSDDIFIENKKELDIAITRFDQQPVTIGQGVILSLSIITEGNLIFYEGGSRTFNITLDSMRLVDDQLNTMPLSGDTLTVVVYKDANSLITRTSNKFTPPASIELFPNPTSDRITVRYDHLKVRGYQLSDASGKLLINQALPTNAIQKQGTIEIDSSSFESGMYILGLLHDKGVVIQKLIIR